MISSRLIGIRRSVFALACGLVMVNGACPSDSRAAEVIFQDDLEGSIEGDWANANPTGLNSWTTDDSFSPTHSLRVHTAHWYTRSLALEPFAHYSIEFKGKTTGTGMWGTLEDYFSAYGNSGEWSHNFKMVGNPFNVPMTNVIFLPTTTSAHVYVDDVVVKKLTSGEAAAVQDQFFATMPAFTFTPPPERHANLTRTLGKLNSGGDVKVVMLGDSIIADTSRGYFEPLVERMYPGSNVDVVASVRNSTGMWWYKEENRLQSYVFDHDPDLVMIGGISHQDDVASVREVIRQIKAARPETEILLMSELAGANNPYVRPELRDALDPTVPGWRSEMYCLAIEMGVEFVDMTKPWADYIVSSGKPYDYFMRDSLHLNARGSQVAGRIVESYFAVNPEPGAVSVLGMGALTLLRRRKR